MPRTRRLPAPPPKTKDDLLPSNVFGDALLSLSGKTGAAARRQACG
ncbi:MAG TPA: hypothetical protein VEZ40_00250 [Pyrinomonadaceae bacterium]|nr:hypothetical protein [Pyrinomonadaceae bacterium]